jgi:GT2 family glycosyltransferase
MNELISVVILNWNGKAYIRACLDSVFAQDYGNLEVIVVDNGSDDGSPDIVEGNYRDVVLIRNGRNLGFGAGNNIGIRHAAGEYVLILNNDAEMDRCCISALKGALDRDSLYGAAESRILFKRDPGTLDAAGILALPDGLSMGRGRYEPADRYEREEEIFFSSGCCALYRRQMLEDIKVFGEYYDEDFFAYADDTDLGWRARIRGWKCIYAPEAKVYHMHSASYGTYSPLKAFLVERTRIWVQIKNLPAAAILYGQFFTAARYLYQAYGAFTGKGASGDFCREHSRGELVKILCKSYFSALYGLPKMLRKRKEIQKKKAIGSKEVFRLLKAYAIGARAVAFKQC